MTAHDALTALERAAVACSLLPLAGRCYAVTVRSADGTAITAYTDALPAGWGPMAGRAIARNGRLIQCELRDEMTDKEIA